MLEAEESSLQGELVALGAEPADDPAREVREIAVVTERFARVHVRQVDLDERDGHRRQGIAQGDARVREGGRVDQDEIDPLAAGALRHKIYSDYESAAAPAEQNHRETAFEPAEPGPRFALTHV